MKLKAEFGGNEHTVLIENSAECLLAKVDDRRYELEIRDLGPGEYVLQQETSLHRCRIEANRELDEFTVHLRGKSYHLRLKDPKRLRGAQDEHEHAHGPARIVAPMPGKLVRILVTVGARVEAGAGLLVIEAMKMQNEMKAPRAGTVVSLRTDAGATVNAGDVLAVVE